jgi:hypothetical protein
MKLTNRDLKQLNPKNFLQPKAGYNLSHIADEEERMVYCKCEPRHKVIIKPCPRCGNRARV